MWPQHLCETKLYLFYLPLTAFVQPAVWYQAVPWEHQNVSRPFLPSLLQNRKQHPSRAVQISKASPNAFMHNSTWTTAEILSDETEIQTDNKYSNIRVPQMFISIAVFWSVQSCLIWTWTFWVLLLLIWWNYYDCSLGLLPGRKWKVCMIVRAVLWSCTKKFFFTAVINVSSSGKWSEPCSDLIGACAGQGCCKCDVKVLNCGFQCMTHSS